MGHRSPVAVLRHLLRSTFPGTEAWRQAFRFGVAGGLITALSALVYVIAAVQLGTPPLIANVEGYIVGVLAGYRLHAHWTFREQWDLGTGELASRRFFMGSLFTFALNSLWTWALTVVFRGPDWLPLVPMTTATPLASFVINRRWVFTGTATA